MNDEIGRLLEVAREELQSATSEEEVNEVFNNFIEGMNYEQQRLEDAKRELKRKQGEALVELQSLMVQREDEIRKENA